MSKRSTVYPAAQNASATTTSSGALQLPPAPCVSTRPRSLATCRFVKKSIDRAFAKNSHRSIMALNHSFLDKKFMCCSIKVLRRPETPVTPEEISAAVREIAAVTDKLVKKLPSRVMAA